jgi:hypothetical protein
MLRLAQLAQITSFNFNKEFQSDTNTTSSPRENIIFGDAKLRPLHCHRWPWTAVALAVPLWLSPAMTWGPGGTLAKLHGMTKKAFHPLAM